ncbi:MAG: Fe-S oxidoreductase, partial [Chryseobacterium sp.]
MHYIDNILFVILLIAGFGLFTKSLQKIYRNIRLGREINRSDRKNERWETMARVAMGQSRMSARPVAGVLHLFVYV